MAVATLLPRSVRRGASNGRLMVTGLALGRSAGLPVREAAPTEVPVPGLARPIVVKMATTPDEWRQALALASNNYQYCGYETPGAEYRFTSYHALPDTAVLIAKEGARVLATYTLVPDNTLLGLPMESNYPAEIEQFRREGRRIVETTCLADRGLALREFVPVFLGLFQLAWQYATSRVTNVIHVTPQHAHFYTRALGYVPLGPGRACPHVQGTVGVALYLDAALMAARVPKIHQRTFGQRLPATALQAPRLPAHLHYRFAARSNQTNLNAVQKILAQVAASGSPRRW